MRRRARLIAFLLPAMLAGCSEIQSAIAPSGPDAARIADLAWLLFIGAAVVFAIVGAALVIALYGPMRARRALAGNSVVIVGGIAFPVVVLTLLLAYGVWVMRENTAHAAPAMQVEVKGEQWWWRVAYALPDGARIHAANEIRVPVGREVEFVLSSPDVIHSFWVPSLGGKVDMIPGRTTKLRLTAERSGIYRGQCAEYCGGPHALMALEIRALPPEEFEAWRAAALQTPAEPTQAAGRRGRDLFLSAGCAACHRIAGTPAQGAVGPDLTRVGARRFIAAGTLETTPENIARFIANGQHIKPGNRMPPFRIFAPDELDALAAYLASLK